MTLYLALGHKLLLPLLMAVSSAGTPGFDHSHQILTEVLQEYVDEGWVDYAALKKNPEKLRVYLNASAAVKRVEFKAWSEPQRFTYLVNLYNAQTLDLIISNYPVGSIKDIGGFFSGPWKQDVVRLFGEKQTLAHVEHELLRKKFLRPEVHFALVCGAVGCPPLRSSAYTAGQLDAQLKEQGEIFFRTRSKNRLDLNKRRLYLSRIFKWFSEDFEKKSGSVLAFVTPFFSAAERKALKAGGFSIAYTDYDWSLNDKRMKAK